MSLISMHWEKVFLSPWKFPLRLTGSLWQRDFFLSQSPPLSPPPSLSFPGLCNSCCSVLYPERVMISVFFFQSVFLEQMARGELGNVPALRWGMCQFLQRVSSLGFSSRAFTLPSALSGASRTSQLALRTSGVWDCQENNRSAIECALC